MTTSLELDPHPRSVREARAWVVQQLSGLERDDLVDAARVGVSELVTNAILHAEPPIVVRLGGTPVHPRVEVHDSSVQPPSMRDMTDEARLLATIGRGLSIVAMHSRSWGAEMSPSGKIVWFEPASDHELTEVVRPITWEIVAHVKDASPVAGEPKERVEICLLGMPVRVYAHFQLWYEELRRELRLLALSHSSEYPVAQELSTLSATVAAEYRQTNGTDMLAAAIARGDDRADLMYDAPASSLVSMTRLREVLLHADEFCREHRLLTAGPTPQLLDLRAWYFGEFERQGRGEEPRPWKGSLSVEPPVS